MNFDFVIYLLAMVGDYCVVVLGVLVSVVDYVRIYAFSDVVIPAMVATIKKLPMIAEIVTNFRARMWFMGAMYGVLCIFTSKDFIYLVFYLVGIRYVSPFWFWFSLILYITLSLLVLVNLIQALMYLDLPIYYSVVLIPILYVIILLRLPLLWLRIV